MGANCVDGPDLMLRLPLWVGHLQARVTRLYWLHADAQALVDCMSILLLAGLTSHVQFQFSTGRPIQCARVTALVVLVGWCSLLLHVVDLTCSGSHLLFEYGSTYTPSPAAPLGSLTVLQGCHTHRVCTQSVITQAASC